MNQHTTTMMMHRRIRKKAVNAGNKMASDWLWDDSNRLKLIIWLIEHIKWIANSKCIIKCADTYIDNWITFMALLKSLVSTQFKYNTNTDMVKMSLWWFIFFTFAAIAVTVSCVCKLCEHIELCTFMQTIAIWAKSITKSGFIDLGNRILNRFFFRWFCEMTPKMASFDAGVLTYSVHIFSGY